MFQKAFKIILCTIMAVCMVGFATTALAKVTAEEAARLKKDLTPFGSERAGNAEGTIPAWEGGLTDIPEGVSFDPEKDKVRPDPFAGDTVMFTITAQNVDQYGDKITPGVKALMKKYPDTFKMNIYPTHRTAAGYQWMYDNTYQNALNAELVETYSVTNAYGGIPFPIPKNGVEAMQNHLLKFYAYHWTTYDNAHIVYPNGSRSSSAGTKNWRKFPFYDPDGSVETFKGDASKGLWYFNDPARRKGELILAIDPIDYRGTNDRKAWQYLPGQRRVRRAPSIAFDTPAPAAGGNGNYDDLFMFNGSMERFDWKLIGKKECFIPYNNYQIKLTPHDDWMTPHHMNPEYLRWELHRVWVVEATLRTDKRHNYGRRVFHLDEDTWMNTLQDNYDTRGGLWRTNMGTSKSFYDIGLVRQEAAMHYDLQTETWAVSGSGYEDPDKKGYDFTSEVPDSTFTPQQVRKLGLR